MVETLIYFTASHIICIIETRFINGPIDEKGIPFMTFQINKEMQQVNCNRISNVKYLKNIV